MAHENPPDPILELEFEEATKFVRGNIAASASSEDLLYFYARFKQVGACIGCYDLSVDGNVRV